MINNRRLTISRKFFGNTLIIVLIGGIALIGLDRIGWLTWLRQFGEKTIIVPVRQLKHDRFLAGRLNNQACETETEANKQDVLMMIKDLTEENRQLSRMLSLPLVSKWQFIKLKVIGAGSDKLILSGGSLDGVTLGMPVLLAEDNFIYIGKVGKITSGQTEVDLPSRYNNRLEVVVLSPEVSGSIVARGLAIGQGGGRIEVEQILNQETVKNGDLVGYQYGDKLLFLGKITEVSQDEGGIFKKAVVEATINPLSLMTVFLVK